MTFWQEMRYITNSEVFLEINFDQRHHAVRHTNVDCCLESIAVLSELVRAGVSVGVRVGEW